MFIYRTTYRDRKILLGFETSRVKRTYVETESQWIYYPPYGRFILSTRKVIRTTNYREDLPVNPLPEIVRNPRLIFLF